MGHNAHNLNQYHHINYNNHPSECDLNSKLKDLKEETSQNSFSNIEVIQAAAQTLGNVGLANGASESAAFRCIFSVVHSRHYYS